MASLPEAAYPGNRKIFTPKVNLQDVVDAVDVNSAYTEIFQIESDLLGTVSVDTNGTTAYSELLSKSRLTSGNTFRFDSTVPSTWAGGLRARLLNIEAGLYTAYTDRLSGNGNGQISLTNIGTKGLSIRGTGIKGTVTAASVSSGVVTFTVTGLTSSATFSAGQTVTITGVRSTSNTSGLDKRAFNFTGTIASMVGSSPHTGYTINIPNTYPSTWTDAYTSAGTAVVYQTANLQEWLRYNGTDSTVVAAVTATGSFHAKTIYGGDASSAW
jgi:hypothetical protein